MKCDECRCITRAMSQFTINALTNEGRREIPVTVVPESAGLAISDEKILTTYDGRQYVIYHVASGTQVSSGRTKQITQRLAAMIAPLADWTLPQTELCRIDGLVKQLVQMRIAAHKSK